MIKKRLLIKIIVVFLMLLNLGGHKIFNGSEVITQYVNLINTVVAILMYFLLTRDKHYGVCVSRYKRGKEQRFCLYVLLLGIIQIVVTSLEFGSSVGQVFNNSRYYWCLLFVPAVLYLLNAYEAEDILDLIYKIVIVIQILRLIAWAANVFGGISLFPGFINEHSDEWIRNGRRRMMDTSLVGFELSYALTKVLHSTKFSKRLANILVIVLCCYFANAVTASRAMLISMLITVAVSYFWSQKMRGTLSKIGGFTVGVCIVFVFLSSEYVATLVDSFTENSKHFSSTVVRLEAFDYYTSVLRDRLICGIGFSDGLSAESTILNHGQSGAYYLSDLGLYNVIIKFGLLGAVLLLFIVTYGIKAIKAESNSTYGTLLVALGTYLLTTGLMSNGALDTQRIFSVPIIVAIFIHFSENKYDEGGMSVWNE